MGVYPNEDGHKCIADAIWEADTIDPGTTPLKWKLGYGEASTPEHLLVIAVLVTKARGNCQTKRATDRKRTNTCSKWAISGRLRSCPRISSSCAERANTI